MRARAQLKSTRGGECESRLSITRLLPNAAEAQPRNIKHEHLIVNRGKGNGVNASNGSSQSARKNTSSVRAEPIASSSISSLSRSGLMQRQRNEPSAKKKVTGLATATRSTHIDAQPATSTASSRARSRPTCRCRRRPSRASDQPQDGEASRPRGAADAARSRRRGDRMIVKGEVLAQKPERLALHCRWARRCLRAQELECSSLRKSCWRLAIRGKNRARLWSEIGRASC